MAAENGTRADRESTIRRPNVIPPHCGEVATEENASDQRVSANSRSSLASALFSASRKPSVPNNGFVTQTIH